MTQNSIRHIPPRFVSLSRWPFESTPVRRVSPFRSDYVDTINLLDTELLHISAEDSSIAGDFKETDIRKDGFIRAGARTVHPGILVSYRARGEPYEFPCDTFREWSANLRAIALGLQALRKIDRHGITNRGQQYVGFQKALSAPKEDLRYQGIVYCYDTVLNAASLIGGLVKEKPSLLLRYSQESQRLLFREALGKVHPDGGGDPETFRRVKEATDVLREWKRREVIASDGA